MSAPSSPEPPVQASDPARLWNGQLVSRDVLEMPTGGSFTVDLARAPETIRELETARDRLTELLRDARVLGKVDPGTTDQVSLDAAAVFGAVADGGAGSLTRALESGVQRLDLLIEAVRAELLEYGRGDDGLRPGFDAPHA